MLCQYSMIPVSVRVAVSILSCSFCQNVARTLASFDLEMLERLAVKCTKVHEDNLEKFRQNYYDDVTKKGQKSQTETEN